MATLSPKAKLLCIALVLVQLFDIVLHVAIGQVELIRIVASLNIMLWVAAVWFDVAHWINEEKGGVRYTGIYLLLHLFFLWLNGFTNPELDGAPRTMLFLLVGLTVSLAGWLIVTLRLASK